MILKNSILFLCFFCGLTWTADAQKMNDVFNEDVPIAWLGLDFTGAKLIGDREKYGSSSDVKFLVKAWNDLIDAEKNKYNVARATKKKAAEYHSEVARNHNEEIDISELLSNNREDHLHLKEEDIRAIVRTYDFQGLTGIGLMFNIESFSKLEGKAAIWVTFIDLASKEVIFADRVISPPGGNGLRNYWGGSISATMDKMAGKQMELWRKQYAR
jgi:hypothetical protein